MFEAPRQIQPVVAGSGEVAIAPAAVVGIDVRHISSVIWRGKTTILRTMAASLLMAMLVVLVVPAQYTAVTQILIDPTDLHAVGNDPNPSNQGNETAVLQVESQVRVLASDSVLRRVIAAEALDRDPEFVAGPGVLRRAMAAFGLGGARHTDPALNALDALKQMLKVRRAERTYVVDISVTNQDPAKAARAANAVAQAYLAEQTTVRSDAARQISQSLSARLDELKDRVRAAEDRVETFKARNNIVGASGQLVNEQQLSELNNQLGAARARTAAAKARLDQVERLQLSKDETGAFPEAVQSQTVMALRSQYAEVMRREAEQMTSLGQRHPAVIEIQAEATRLRKMIDDEVHRIALAARSEYESARANEAALAANLETLKHNAVTTNEAMVTLRELERDVQASRAVYESFLVRARETGEQEQLDTKNIRVISRAEVPRRRSFPPSNTLLALGALIFGVGAGTGIVLLRDAQGNGSPRAGAAGAVRREWARAARKLWPAVPASSSLPILAVLPNVDTSFGLNEAEDPNSLFAVEIRKVLDAVLTNHKARGNPTILVAASDDEDDTAAVALTFAAVAAATQRVLLIDADLQRRTLSAIDADQTQAGLIDVATGRRQLSEVITRDQETNLNLASFVSPNSRRDRPISEADVRQAFDRTKRFDMVIVAAVDLTGDPSVRFFAGLVDHILLVARTDPQSKTAVEQFIDRLGADAHKIRGEVLISAQAA
ncbi:MAG TPA: exopolysaccharide transport family protein [Xanthobacteraceae bacterium]|nr:exopolysaccharide transport family protein [Xanthobacteraceae bacterium]